VVRPDLREDHLDDLFLFVVGHDEPIVDDRFDSLALKRDRGSRWLGIKLVALDEELCAQLDRLRLHYNLHRPHRAIGHRMNSVAR
jgi:transposase InsO family protein